MIKIIASIITGIFVIIGGYVNNQSTEPIGKLKPSTPIIIDTSHNKTIEDSHDTIIINTTKMTKVDNANNVIIK